MPGTKLPLLPVPPGLGPALGYPGNARYVVFYLDADLDDVMYNDGVRAGTGSTWVFQGYRRHPAVEPLLRDFDLTSAQSDLCLVFDLEGTRASIASATEAAEFLRRHRQPLPPAPPMTEPLRSLAEQLQEGFEEVKVDHNAVAKAMAEQRGRVGRLMSWLDQCPTPPRRGHTP
ncbi:Uncharacterized protein OS=Meiothermus silvanus (strain ATCC 700542 / DSM 9946 / VI-R2) GN=Mesil_2842 PE=4 SV=1 [Gemmata massiliana]|uniref:Uncharacterized protein n=1 Tax=Gemmata massiliana TaxID=1210884 RepID=A0A6P2D4V8_9BACT|nr:Uncharacterized protein OS=Meiothermus silvanus (strain ATCC 700542 / DSM 9946 / VI-R2) GN=Mesil_2842 PE=4 SV=1 [Gemmata massiliana]